MILSLEEWFKEYKKLEQQKNKFFIEEVISSKNYMIFYATNFYSYLFSLISYYLSFKLNFDYPLLLIILTVISLLCTSYFMKLKNTQKIKFKTMENELALIGSIIEDKIQKGEL